MNPSRSGAVGTRDTRARSSVVFDGPERAFARAYMKGIGFDDEELSRPTVGIANTWIEAMPCNYHLRGLAEHIKSGVREAGGTPMEFNTIAISDGVTMGTQGMKASLVSREVIADSIELAVRGYQFDARGRGLGLRQDDPGLRDGAGAARHPLADALRRLDPAGALARPGRDDPGRVRGDRRLLGRSHERGGPLRARGLRQPRPGSLRRPVHRQHHGLCLRGDGDRPDGLGDGPRGRRDARSRSRWRPAVE